MLAPATPHRTTRHHCRSVREAGIDALLDLTDIVNEGAYGNVFHR
ncbi:hypothetical protein [Lentzea sp. NPDC004782]